MLAACVWLVACATGPEPTKRKKRKKKSSDDTEQVVRGDRDDDDDNDDRPRKDTAERDETPAQKRARSKKRKKQEAEERKRREEARRQEEEAAREKAAAEEEQREREEAEAAARKKKKTKARRSDDDGDADADKKRAEAEAEAKKREAEAEAEAKKREAEDKKRAKAADPVDEGPVIDMTGDEAAAPADEERAEAIPVPGIDTSGEAPRDEAAPTSTLSYRPLTLPKGKLEVHGGLRITALTLPDMMSMTETSSTSTGLALGGSYGVTEDLEIGGDYAAGVSPGTAKGPLTLRAAYSLQRGKLDVALAGAFAVDFYEFSTMMGTASQTYTSLQLGGWVRYHASAKLSLFTGLPALPASPVALTKLALPLPPFTYQLQLGLTGGITRALGLPIGVGLQATPSIYMFATVNLAHIRIANTENAFLFADAIPLALGAFYTRRKLDVGVVFADDLRQGFDYLRFETVLRYSL